MSTYPLASASVVEINVNNLQLQNRITTHHGSTARRGRDIGLLYDAELREPLICEKLNNLCFFCSEYDLSRSYLYVRENSIEYNYAITMCCCLNMECFKYDCIKVSYFDRKPYTKDCAYVFPCFFTCQQPKLEIVDPACMCLFVKLDFCCPKMIAFMPFEQMPIPCCCCANRVGPCDNYCGLCGPVTGSPKIYFGLPGFPQPLAPEEFITQLRVAAPVLPDN